MGRGEAPDSGARVEPELAAPDDQAPLLLRQNTLSLFPGLTGDCDDADEDEEDAMGLPALPAFTRKHSLAEPMRRASSAYAPGVARSSSLLHLGSVTAHIFDAEKDGDGEDTGRATRAARPASGTAHEGDDDHPTRGVAGADEGSSSPVASPSLPLALAVADGNIEIDAEDVGDDDDDDDDDGDEEDDNRNNNDAGNEDVNGVDDSAAAQDSAVLTDTETAPFGSVDQGEVDAVAPTSSRTRPAGQRPPHPPGPGSPKRARVAEPTGAD